MKEIVERLTENRQVELAKKLLESKGYNVTKKSKRVKESASVKRRYLKEGLDNSSYLYHRSNSPINSFNSAISKEIGLHCGTREQADNLSGGYLYRIKLSDQEFMHLNYDVTGTYGSLEFLKAMKDSNSIDDSDYEDLMRRLRQYGGEEDKERSYSRVYREFIIKKGYVGFVYPNSIEGEGDSYCICDSSAIEEFELVEGEARHNESRRVRGRRLKESTEGSQAERGDRVRIVKDIEDYQSRGYKDNKKGYVVTKREPHGVFIKEYGYIILDGDYEIVK